MQTHHLGTHKTRSLQSHADSWIRTNCLLAACGKSCLPIDHPRPMHVILLPLMVLQATKAAQQGLHSMQKRNCNPMCIPASSTMSLTAVPPVTAWTYVEYTGTDRLSFSLRSKTSGMASSFCSSAGSWCRSSTRMTRSPFFSSACLSSQLASASVYFTLVYSQEMC